MRKRRPRGCPKNTCSKCDTKIEETRKGQMYCRSCHNEYMRLTRPKHSQLSDEQRKKANARSYANVYIKRGLIKKRSCQECGFEKAQMHHEDYSKPLEIIWMCRPCHLLFHKNGAKSIITSLFLERTGMA